VCPVKKMYITRWFGLWCLMPLSTKFQLMSYIGAVSFIGEGNGYINRFDENHVHT